jgi:hypothetical protein
MPSPPSLPSHESTPACHGSPSLCKPPVRRSSRMTQLQRECPLPLLAMARFDAARAGVRPLSFRHLCSRLYLQCGDLPAAGGADGDSARAAAETTSGELSSPTQTPRMSSSCHASFLKVKHVLFLLPPASGPRPRSSRLGHSLRGTLLRPALRLLDNYHCPLVQMSSLGRERWKRHLVVPLFLHLNPLRCVFLLPRERPSGALRG